LSAFPAASFKVKTYGLPFGVIQGAFCEPLTPPAKFCDPTYTDALGVSVVVQEIEVLQLLAPAAIVQVVGFAEIEPLGAALTSEGTLSKRSRVTNPLKNACPDVAMCTGKYIPSPSLSFVRREWITIPQVLRRRT
jgi:hypothetical protein